MARGQILAWSGAVAIAACVVFAHGKLRAAYSVREGKVVGVDEAIGE